jgi:3-hydroxyisobutyrate dehydrogenase-like beta-hydroxyacid dehydrogenase
MGSALARAFARAGQHVMVWNRTAAKARPLQSAGIEVAESLVDLLSFSDMTVACVANYEIAADLLANQTCELALRNKTLVNYTTGSPSEARIWSQWAEAHGTRYLDGAIMTYPKIIGAPECLIFNAGSQEAYDTHADQLKALGGQVRFVNADPGVANCLDGALLSFYYASSFGFMMSAAALDTEKVDPALLMPAIGLFQPTLAESFTSAGALIAAGAYSGEQATLKTHFAGLEGVRRHAASGGLDTSVLTSMLALMGRAITRGYGNDELPAVYEVIRNLSSED